MSKVKNEKLFQEGLFLFHRIDILEDNPTTDGFYTVKMRSGKIVKLEWTRAYQRWVTWGSQRNIVAWAMEEGL